MTPRSHTYQRPESEEVHVLRAALIGVALSLVLALAGPAAAQSPPEAEASAPQVVLAAQPSARSGQRLQWLMSFGTAFDSNIDHNRANSEAYGGVLGAGVRFRSNVDDPAFEVTYEAALHSYTQGTRWDRVSQQARALWEVEFAGPWTFGLVGEMSLKGSSEDRELSDQFVAEPRLEYTFSDAHRIRVYGAYRLRRYTDDPLRDADNPMVGVEFRRRTDRGDRLEVGLRFDRNQSLGTRHRYDRWTLSTGYGTPVSRLDRLDFELRFRAKRYRFRVVEIEDEDFARLDHQWIPSITWSRTLFGDLESQVEYRWESRISNDPNRDFQAHLIAVRVVQRW